ncbi:MAG: hypothetical protein LH475_05030 [Cryobacterium sp.]|uniref:hypothetical protein n=1 Tax=Cryobacterium sp. TaxID=1926290 RepID=UPI00228D4268|nr:hypothetical protein [Cryobacterium sp.]MCY7403983.1 hypothetical protein [Cryobacterium sp.]
MTNNRLIDIPTSAANGADNGRIIDPYIVAQANDRVTQTGALDLLASWRTPHQRAGHERSTVSDRVILVGLVLLAGERSPHTITTLADLIQHRFAPESRELLCLPTPESNTDLETACWYSRTGDAYHRLLDLMDPFPQKRGRTFTFTETQAALDAHDPEREMIMKARLDTFTNAFLQMTFREQPQNLREGTISLAIGEKLLASPSRRGHSRVRRSSSPKWGWSACIALVVNSEEAGAPRKLQLAIGATVNPPSAASADAALNVMGAALLTRLPIGVVHADKRCFPAAPDADVGSALEAKGSMHAQRVLPCGSPEWEAPRGHAGYSLECLNARIHRSTGFTHATGALSTIEGLAAAQLALTIVLTDANLRTIAAAAARSEQPAPH